MTPFWRWRLKPQLHKRSPPGIVLSSKWRSGNRPEFRQEQQVRRVDRSIPDRPGVSPHVVDSVERMIEQLSEALTQLQGQIQSHLVIYPDLEADAIRLRQVPGIGAKNVLPLLVVLSRWQSLTLGQGTAKGLTAFDNVKDRLSLTRQKPLTADGKNRKRHKLEVRPHSKTKFATILLPVYYPIELFLFFSG
jgi:hypothetical protein